MSKNSGKTEAIQFIRPNIASPIMTLLVKAELKVLRFKDQSPPTLLNHDLKTLRSEQTIHPSSFNSPLFWGCDLALSR
jgi:hypothetical protein